MKAMRLVMVLWGVVVLAGVAWAADPVVESVSSVVKGNEHVTVVEVTFTFSDADGDACHVALFGHDAVTRDHYPMVTFAEGDIYSQTFAPGTHTVTWVASADWESTPINASDFVVYVQVSDSGRIAPGQYVLIDVSGGPSAASYPVEYKDYVDVSQELYKTDVIVLRELPDGSYAGVYEITQRQYELVTGQTPSSFSGNPMRPVERVSWDDITGTGSYTTGFIAELRNKTGLTALDLPESAAWEYSCRAGTTYHYNDYTQNQGKGSHSTASLDILGWYDSNSGSRTHDAGEMQANAWGLYDMHGNVWEWTLTASGAYRIFRGGGWGADAVNCQSGIVFNLSPAIRYSNLGFRLFLPPGQ